MNQRVAVTGLGVVSPLGLTPQALAEGLAAGRSALSASPALGVLADDRAGRVDKIPVRPWLKRRKDRKLMARASELALAAAGPALAGFEGDRTELGVFLAVGREPPDDGESEAALAAASRDGKLDADRLAGPGRDRYPPLLPLKTLPNMALAHVSIHLDVMGENGAWAGEVGAGQRAIVAGVRAVAERRCPAALVGGADSLVDLGSARDRLRLGAKGPPGEGAAMLLLEPLEQALASGRRVLAVVEVGSGESDGEGLLPQITAAMGALGAASVPLELAAHIAAGCASSLTLDRSDAGDVSAAISVFALSA